MDCPYCSHVSADRNEHANHITDEHQDLLEALHVGDITAIVGAVGERAGVPVEV